MSGRKGTHRIRITSLKELKRMYASKFLWSAVQRSMGLKRLQDPEVTFYKSNLISTEAKFKLKSFWFRGRKIKDDDIVVAMDTNDPDAYLTMYSGRRGFVVVDITSGVSEVSLRKTIRIRREYIDGSVSQYGFVRNMYEEVDLSMYFQDVMLPTPDELTMLELEDPHVYKAIIKREFSVFG